MNISSLSSLVLITATTGLASFGFANTELAARLPLEGLMAVVVSLGLIRFAFSDYARRPKRLATPAPVRRPAVRRTVRVSARSERVAA